MGDYTPNLKFYKPEPDEFIDVETQLNRNLDIADATMKRLFEYEYTVQKTPDIVGTVNRSRFYKAYSNSIFAYFTSTKTWWQDPVSPVYPWIRAREFLIEGWIEHPDYPLCYRVIKKSGSSVATVEWTGAIQYVTREPIDTNLNQNFIAAGVIPVGVRPSVSKYYQVNAGNTSANYAIARVFMGSTGAAEIKKYGNVPSAGANSENRIELTGISYDVNVTG